jgi:hypothetical protein
MEFACQRKRVSHALLARAVKGKAWIVCDAIVPGVLVETHGGVFGNFILRKSREELATPCKLNRSFCWNS